VSDALKLHVRPDLSESAMVIGFEGWNDAGESATTALRYLDEAIHSVPLAEIDPDEFYDFTVMRPSIVPVETHLRRVEWPSNAFRYGAIDSSREIVVGIGVEPHLRWRRYCDTIVQLASDIGVRRVVLVGAYLADVVYSQPVALTGYSSSPDELERIGVGGTSYQGPTGIVGVLTERLQREGLSVASLWAGLPHYIEQAPNPRGALALIQKLTELLDFRIDVDPLRSSAAQFEQDISKVVANDAELSEYVRHLKRREFAQ
jgi:proteasome assembly chaperone (PAC2) family protein